LILLRSAVFYTIGIFLGLGSLLFTFIKIFFQKKKIAIKIRTFLLATLAYGSITYISIVSNYELCSYENEEILFTNRHDSSIKIVKRAFACGAVDSEEPQIKIHQIVENAYFFAKATVIDTAKIEKKDWIKVRIEKVIDEKKYPIQKDSIDTIVLNKAKIIRRIDKKWNHFLCLTTLEGDTIVSYEEDYFKEKFLDINEDGYKDIRVFIRNHIYNLCDNYFFDKETKTYKYIENPEAELNIKKIKGKNLYYSYNIAGCADYDWESHLYLINDYKATVIGYMITRNCENDRSSIKIYKGKGENQKLIQQFPVKNQTKTNDNKFKFLKNYWLSNYHKFE
jgi:hypothetical protein